MPEFVNNIIESGKAFGKISEIILYISISACSLSQIVGQVYKL